MPEAQPKDTGAGIVPASTGWFVLNARDARWFDRPGRGNSAPLTGSAEFEAEETQDGYVAHARFPPAQPSRYRDGLLPD